MNNFKANCIGITIMVLVAWFLLSLMASGITVKQGSCDLEYPIGYIFYTGWFCPMSEVSYE